MSRAEEAGGQAELGGAWPAVIALLSRRLEHAFDTIVPWLETRDEVLDFRPGSEHPGTEAWSVREVCEHATLANRYLLVLARKIADKSLRRLAAGRPWPDGAPRFEHLEALGRHAFRWERPEHMVPTGAASMDALRAQLAAQRAECLALLARAPRGEGTLHRIRMSAVEGDDRLDLYQFLTVIALHLERHAAQMERNKRELEAR